MNKKLVEILFSEGKFMSHRVRDDFFRENHPQLYSDINDKFPIQLSWNGKLYCELHDIEPPICPVCNKPVELLSFNKGFRTYCSKQCISRDNIVKEKKRLASIKKYGVDNPNKAKVIKDKKKKTSLERYGVDVPSKSQNVKDKTKKYFKEKYGVENPFQSKEIREKIKEVLFERYGVEHSSKIDGIVEKRKKTFIEKYGVDNPNKSEVVKLKTKERNNAKYIEKITSLLGEDVKIVTTPNEDVVVINYCDKHNDFIISKYNLYNRIRYGLENICTKCNDISSQSSIKEGELKEWIKSLDIEFSENNRNVLMGKEIDIYIPSKKIGIEFDGLYYHSDIFVDNTYHLEKTVLANRKGIDLIHVFEDEWVYKREIVKSIINSKLGLVDKRIFGRKCEVREVLSDISNDFLNRNHIQGRVNSSVRLGLYYDDELVSLMTFGKSRISLGSKNSLGDVYEMYRFCNQINTLVVGGASKLFKYFLEKYTPKRIISFSDNRYFNGELYTKLGFQYIEDTKPNYWYVKGIERYHRFNFRKDKLVLEGYDKSMTENNIMIERGYVRIYDCGNKKYELIIS